MTEHEKLLAEIEATANSYTGERFTAEWYTHLKRVLDMMDRLPEVHTPQPWPQGTRFTKHNYHGGVLREYTVEDVVKNLLMCTPDHDPTSLCCFGIRELDRMEMQGKVKRLS